MINNAIIMGRITAEPELKTTSSGVSVSTITVAVDRSFAKQGEDKQTDFIDVVAWRKTAEFLTKYFHKGSMIAVQGSIQTRSYEDKDGRKRKGVEIVADNISFCGEKKDASQCNQGKTAPKGTTSDDFDMLELDDEDTPY